LTGPAITGGNSGNGTVFGYGSVTALPPVLNVNGTGRTSSCPGPT